MCRYVPLRRSTIRTCICLAKKQSLHALEELVHQAGGEVAGRMAVLAEGDAQKREDIVYLEKLPVFNADGTVKG